MVSSLNLPEISKSVFSITSPPSSGVTSFTFGGKSGSALTIIASLTEDLPSLSKTLAEITTDLPGSIFILIGLNSSSQTGIISVIS